MILAAEAYDHNKFLWPIRPKLHRVDEALRRACRTRVNPASFWTFALEDRVGAFTRICAQVHGQSIATRPIERYDLSFFVFLRDSMQPDTGVLCLDQAALRSYIVVAPRIWGRVPANPIKLARHEEAHDMHVCGRYVSLLML